MDDDFNLQGYEAALISMLFYCSCYIYQSTQSHIAEGIISVHSQLIMEIASEYSSNVFGRNSHFTGRYIYFHSCLRVASMGTVICLCSEANNLGIESYVKKNVFTLQLF